jgi:hypothetical protein
MMSASATTTTPDESVLQSLVDSVVLSTLGPDASIESTDLFLVSSLQPESTIVQPAAEPDTSLGVPSPIQALADMRLDDMGSDYSVEFVNEPAHPIEPTAENSKVSFCEADNEVFTIPRNLSRRAEKRLARQALKSETPDVARETLLADMDNLTQRCVKVEMEQQRAVHLLAYFKKYSCFDKRDYALVEAFQTNLIREHQVIETELRKFGSTAEPLVRMKLIVERRVQLLDHATQYGSMESSMLIIGSSLFNDIILRQKEFASTIVTASQFI